MRRTVERFVKRRVDRGRTLTARAAYRTGGRAARGDDERVLPLAPALQAGLELRDPLGGGDGDHRGAGLRGGGLAGRGRRAGALRLDGEQVGGRRRGRRCVPKDEAIDEERTGGQ